MLPTTMSLTIVIYLISILESQLPNTLLILKTTNTRILKNTRAFRYSSIYKIQSLETVYLNNSTINQLEDCQIHKQKGWQL
jgi:hypothetical protein